MQKLRPKLLEYHDPRKAKGESEAQMKTKRGGTPRSEGSTRMSE